MIPKVLWWNTVRFPKRSDSYLGLYTGTRLVKINTNPATFSRVKILAGIKAHNTSAKEAKFHDL